MDRRDRKCSAKDKALKSGAWGNGSLSMRPSGTPQGDKSGAEGQALASGGCSDSNRLEKWQENKFEG